jgi:hypothetical protein
MSVNSHQSNPPSIAAQRNPISKHTVTFFTYFAWVSQVETRTTISGGVFVLCTFGLCGSLHTGLGMFALPWEVANTQTQESFTPLAEICPIHNRGGTQRNLGAPDWTASQLYVHVSEPLLHYQTSKPHASKTDEKKRTATYRGTQHSALSLRMANRRDVSVFSDILDHLTWYRMFESASVGHRLLPSSQSGQSCMCLATPESLPRLITFLSHSPTAIPPMLMPC